MLSVSVRTLAVAAGCALLLLVAASVGVGYQLAQPQLHDGAAARHAVLLDPDRPEGRALLDQVGSLAGRLSRLEGEAAALAQRLGREPVANPQPAPAAAGPAGGPFLPANLERARLDTPFQDLAQLEHRVGGLEATFAELGGAAVAHELEDMAFPYRLPMLGDTLEVSSAFGPRRDPFTGRRARHAGIDFPAPRGTPILASGGGRVIAAGYNGAYGRTVIIDHGAGLRTLYGHASKLLVKVGDVVLPQQPIALVGSTGRSSGPHLHFEVIHDGTRVNPSPYLAQVLTADSAQ